MSRVSSRDHLNNFSKKSSYIYIKIEEEEAKKFKIFVSAHQQREFDFLRMLFLAFLSIKSIISLLLNIFRVQLSRKIFFAIYLEQIDQNIFSFSFPFFSINTLKNILQTTLCEIKTYALLTYSVRIRTFRQSNISRIIYDSTYIIFDKSDGEL